MIKSALIGLLGVLTIVLTVACANEAATVEVTHFEADTEAVRAERVQGDPPQLVTETWLRRQLDISIAKLWAIPIAEALAGPAHRFTSRVVDVDADTWDDDHQVHLTVILNDGPGRQRHLPMTFTFGGYDYDKASGSVVQGKCTQLPGAGVSTTGEFTTVRNGTDASIEHKISKTVEESNSSSVSLDESVELSNKTTVEAGTDFGAGSGSVSNEFSATFGIDKSSTEDHSKTTSVTVEDTINVSPDRTVAITFTTDDAAVDCDVDINAEGDWSSIKVEAEAPFDWQNRGRQWSSWSDAVKYVPTSYSNIQILRRGTALGGYDHRTATIEFDQGDQVYRLLKGFDVRCPHCGELLFTVQAKGLIEQAGDPDSRWVVFDGTRHQTTKKDASYTAMDVTGLDEDCVRDALDDAGKLVSEIDQDGDGVPDACQ